MRAFYQLSAEVSCETVVQRSRFLGVALPCIGVQQTKLLLQQIKQQHPNANHHCYAYIAGAPWQSQQISCSDDGEPAGVAGRPILMELERAELGQVLLIVVRYFGGIKLGKGGMQRAYSDCARQTLALAQKQLKVEQTTLDIVCDYNFQDQVNYALAQYNGEVLAQKFNQQVEMQVQLPQNHYAQLLEKLTNQSNGKILITKK